MRRIFNLNPNNEPITLPNDELMLTIHITEYTDQIKKNDTFYIFADNWYGSFLFCQRARCHRKPLLIHLGGG